VYAWANETGVCRLHYWLWAVAINPGMGCVWAVMVVGSWLQQAGVVAATAVRRAGAKAWWQQSWLVRWLGCPAEQEANGEDRDTDFEMVSIGLHSQTAAPPPLCRHPSWTIWLTPTTGCVWGTQCEPTPPANNTILTHV